MSLAEREKWQRIHSTSGSVHPVEPSAFLAESVAGLAPGRALVLAMGEGRNAHHLARLGWMVDGVDVSYAAVRKATTRLEPAAGSLRGVAADLDEWPMPIRRYDLVCVIHFLSRSLFDPVARALSPGGSVVWETFTRAHAAFGSPRNPAHLLDAGELRTRFAGLAIRRYREVVLVDGGKRRAVASLFATLGRGGSQV